MAAIGTGDPRILASVFPTRSFVARISGSTGAEIRKRRRSSGSHAPVRRFISIVRDALLTSVTWRRPPVSRCTSQESTVPAASSPRRARARAPGTRSSSQASFEAEKYGSRRSPVLRRTISSPPLLRIFSRAPAVRRSCHTMALWTGRPVARSQRTIVSRWLAMPIAARSAAARPACSRASRAASRVVVQIASASCSTKPGCGKRGGSGL